MGTLRENWPCIRVLSVIMLIIAAVLEPKQTISSQTIKQGTHIFHASHEEFMFILGTSCQILVPPVPNMGTRRAYYAEHFKSTVESLT